MKPPKKFGKDGAPAKGFKWQYNTDSPIPNPTVVPMKPNKVKLKPMRTVASGTKGSGAVRQTVKRRSR